MYRALYFQILPVHVYYYTIRIDSICQHKQEPSMCNAFISNTCMYIVFLHYNHCLNFLTQAGAFSPCLYMCSALVSLLASICILLLFIMIFANTWKSLWPLSVYIWCFVFSIFVYILLFLHSLTQSVCIVPWGLEP